MNKFIQKFRKDTDLLRDDGIYSDSATVLGTKMSSKRSGLKRIFMLVRVPKFFVKIKSNGFWEI